MPSKNRKTALSVNQDFCLRRLAETNQCSWAICKAAISARLNSRREARMEWADAPLRALREKRLAEHVVGERSGHGRRVHRITPLGRDVLVGATSRS
ncbi:hypothetical protein GE300_20960 [Rhodobacteraceae bacterium 2CG4]|uniref:Uncharacterized protein n=1 Tax=Halovulum marinum TaxID=2662447 RepID=A0A6L5Z621_9RHOB|nr:hypothetical protein [Halovulum marinum]MSU92028.1 hypothetical protein [Halovulum marinum]